MAEQTSANPIELIKKMGFEKSIEIAISMLQDENWDDNLPAYGTQLLEELKKTNSQQWNSNWKYEALLGYAYDIIMDYDARYDSFKKAYDQITPKPPQLLVALASCCWSPGDPPITKEQAISFAKQAIKEKPYIEALELLSGLYKSCDDIQGEKYWAEEVRKAQHYPVHLPSLTYIYDSSYF